MTIDEIYKVVDQLLPDELKRLGRYIDQKQDERPTDEDIETRIAELHAGLAEFREGLSERDLEVLIDAMSLNFSYPLKDRGMYDWLDELPEDKI